MLAQPPSRIECRERAFDELDRAGAIGARECHADLRRELEDLPIEIDRVLERRRERVDYRIGVCTRANVGQYHADDIVGHSRNARQVGAAFRQVFDDDLGGGFEQAIRKRRVEHALIGDVAADVDQRDAHGVFTQRGHVERHAQGFFEALAMREHRTRALRIEARVIGGRAFAEIAADDQHAIETLHLEAHLELEIAVLVALLRALAGLEDAPRSLQNVRGDR
jgi:hypothetical protein